MKKICLFITEQFEPTADILISELRRRNVPCVRWNLDKYPRGSSITYRFADGFCGANITSDGRRVDVNDVASIWCRGFRPLGFPQETSAADRIFAETEAQRTLDALLTITDLVWVNHPHRYTLANSKPAQLFAAHRLGLRIPATVITNDPDAARLFLTSLPGPAIYKAMSQNLELEPGKALFTGIVRGHQTSKLDLIQLTPGVFQQYVEKDHELRITVVGSRIFAAKIDSQTHAEAKIDWRHIPLDLEHQTVTLPADLATKIHAFMGNFGLLYGAFDFIVTTDNQYVFLEVNPDETNFLVGSRDILLRVFWISKIVQGHAAIGAKRHVILGNLIILRHVRIEIVFPVEFTDRRDVAAKHEAREHRHAQRFVVHHRQRAG